jgi:hypothetical protein
VHHGDDKHALGLVHVENRIALSEGRDLTPRLRGHSNLDPTDLVIVRISVEPIKKE